MSRSVKLRVLGRLNVPTTARRELMKKLVSMICVGLFALSLNACGGVSMEPPDPCKMACDEVETQCKEKAAENEDSTAAAAADAACEGGKDECYAKCDE